MNYSQIRKKIVGPVYSIVTPFLDNDDIDYVSLERYIEYAVAQGAEHFYVMGYNSRYSELSNEEIKSLNGFVIKKVKSIKPDGIMIVADPLHCSTKTSLDFALHAQDAGADVISVINREKYYFDDQIYAHYEYIANHSEIGILVHEMPFLSGLGGPEVNWPLPLLNRIADIDNVVAIKEDAKNDAYSKEVISSLNEKVSFIISGGGKRQWLRNVEYGCQSWLNGIGVFEPKLAAKFWQHYQENNIKACNNIIDLIEVPFFEQGVQIFGWHLAIKAALEERGLMGRHERLPMMALPNDKANIVKELIRSLPIDELIK